MGHSRDDVASAYRERIKEEPGTCHSSHLAAAIDKPNLANQDQNCPPAGEGSRGYDKGKNLVNGCV
jgi:hypothetical protein